MTESVWLLELNVQMHYKEQMCHYKVRHGKTDLIPTE